MLYTLLSHHVSHVTILLHYHIMSYYLISTSCQVTLPHHVSHITILPHHVSQTVTLPCTSCQSHDYIVSDKLPYHVSHIKSVSLQLQSHQANLKILCYIFCQIFVTNSPLNKSENETDAFHTQMFKVSKV